MDNLKRVVAINDISCVGRCSLTVALPMISAAGIECSILPTAILSTHTGGFTGFTFHNLSEEMDKIVAHWKSLNLHVDTLYSGYLGSADQVDKVLNIFNTFKDASRIVDPVMADNGKLYSAFDNTFPSHMARLCKGADVILPNITEACLMTGIEYVDGLHSRQYIEKLLSACLKLGAKNVCLTGVSLEDGKLGAATLSSDGKFSYYALDRIDGYFHGTGDVFGSVFVSAYTLGKSIEEASKLACDITVKAIKETINRPQEYKFGVNFELTLNDLYKSLN